MAITNASGTGAEAPISDGALSASHGKITALPSEGSRFLICDIDGKFGDQFEHVAE